MSQDESLLNCLNPDKLSSHYLDNTPLAEETVCFAFLRHRKTLLDMRAAQQEERTPHLLYRARVGQLGNTNFGCKSSNDSAEYQII